MTAARKLVEPYYSAPEEAVPVIKRVPAPRKRRVPATLKICFVAAICVLSGILYLQQQVTAYYLNIELNRLQEQVKLMEQRNDHLMLTLESQRSLKQIEHVARTQLGMVEPEYTATLVVPRFADPVPEVEARWLADQSAGGSGGGILAAVTAVLNKVLPLGGVEAGTLQR